MITPALRRAAFLLLLALVTVAFFWIISPFFGAVFWAMVLALMFMPVHRRLCARLRGRDTLAALGTLLFCMAIVVVPMIFVVGAMVDEATSFTQRLRTGEFNPRTYFEQIQNALPGWSRDLLGRFGLFNAQDVVDKLTAAVVQGGQALTTRALAIGQNTLMLLVNLGIMLYLLFFFLRDGRDLAQTIRRAVPMQRQHTDFLLSKFATVVRATVKGTVVVALVQGMLGGVALAFLGIHGAVLWGVVMSVLSLLPAIGAALVWAPVAIYLIATGSMIEGLGLAAWGAGVMGLIDNILDLGGPERPRRQHHHRWAGIHSAEDRRYRPGMDPGYGERRGERDKQHSIPPRQGVRGGEPYRRGSVPSFATRWAGCAHRRCEHGGQRDNCRRPRPEPGPHRRAGSDHRRPRPGRVLRRAGLLEGAGRPGEPAGWTQQTRSDSG